MSDDTRDRVRCGGCGDVLDEPMGLAVENRRPCPSCGSLARLFEQTLEGSVGLRSSVGLKARHPGKRRPFLEHFAGADFSRRLRRWMDKLRRIDREGDRYDEVLTDPETGEIIHETHERLTEHRGHGSAREKRCPPELPELGALLEDVAAKAQSVRPSSSEGLSDAEELGLALFVSTFEVFLGIRALLCERLAEEARMLSRTLLEDTARLIWLATSGEELDARALLFHYSSIEHERRLFRAARDNGYEWAESALADLDEELAAVTEEAERTRVELKKLPNARDTLHAMNYGELYYWHVRASQVIHSSRIGLSARFLPRADDPRRIRIMLESPVEEVARVGAMAIQAFSTAIVAANDVLGWNRRDELVEYRDRVRGLSGVIFDRVAGRASPGKAGDSSDGSSP